MKKFFKSLFKTLFFLFILSAFLSLTGCAQNNANNSTITSPELTFEENAKIVPGPPGNLWLSTESDKKTINWQGTRDDTVSYYTIYARCDNESSPKKIVQVKSIGDNSGMYSFGVKNNLNCDYSISATSIYGTEGPKEQVKTVK